MPLPLDQYRPPSSTKQPNENQPMAKQKSTAYAGWSGAFIIVCGLLGSVIFSRLTEGPIGVGLGAAVGMIAGLLLGEIFARAFRQSNGN